MPDRIPFSLFLRRGSKPCFSPAFSACRCVIPPCFDVIFVFVELCSIPSIEYFSGCRVCIRVDTSLPNGLFDGVCRQVDLVFKQSVARAFDLQHNGRVFLSTDNSPRASTFFGFVCPLLGHPLPEPRRRGGRNLFYVLFVLYAFDEEISCMVLDCDSIAKTSHSSPLCMDVVGDWMSQ